MKERKPNVDRKEDTKEMPRKEQVAISRLRTGYTKATHGPKMEGVSNALCPFCNTYLSVDHIQWECKETENQRTNMYMKKTKRQNGKKGMDYKKNRTVQRNIGMEKQPKSIKDHSKEEGNQPR
jgi:hypothetical protein